MNTRYPPAATPSMEQGSGCNALPPATPGPQRPSTTQDTPGTDEQKRSRTADRHREDTDRKALERAENEGLAEPAKREHLPCLTAQGHAVSSAS